MNYNPMTPLLLMLCVGICFWAWAKVRDHRDR